MAAVIIGTCVVVLLSVCACISGGRCDERARKALEQKKINDKKSSM